MGAAFVLLAVCIWRLWSADSIAGLFIDNRLAYPVSYTNNAATLFLVAFWPLMWLAAGREERAPVRGVALGLATGLLGLAIMTQSRGAIWSLAITLVLTFIVSPTRLRTLFYLIVPALLMVYAFPHLNRYWLEGPDVVGGGVGARTLFVASIIAAFIGMILALLERWVQVSRTMKAIFGTVILVGVAGGGGLRVDNAHQRRGRPVRVDISDLGAVHDRSGYDRRVETRVRRGLPLRGRLLEREGRHLESGLAGVRGRPPCWEWEPTTSCFSTTS